MNTTKTHYEGLKTQRVAVTCQPLLKGSPTKIKVKTEGVSSTTEQWVEDDVSTPLQSSISSDIITH